MRFFFFFFNGKGHQEKISEALSKLKYSRFRHIYSKSVRRSEWYDTGPGHGLAVAANPKMIALAIDVPAGGVVQIAKLCRMGRGRMELGKIKDHEVCLSFRICYLFYCLQCSISGGCHPLSIRLLFGRYILRIVLSRI